VPQFWLLLPVGHLHGRGTILVKVSVPFLTLHDTVLVMCSGQKSPCTETRTPLSAQMNSNVVISAAVFIFFYFLVLVSPRFAMTITTRLSIERQLSVPTREMLFVDGVRQ